MTFVVEQRPYDPQQSTADFSGWEPVREFHELERARSFAQDMAATNAVNKDGQLLAFSVTQTFRAE